MSCTDPKQKGKGRGGHFRKCEGGGQHGFTGHQARTFSVPVMSAAIGVM